MQQYHQKEQKSLSSHKRIPPGERSRPRIRVRRLVWGLTLGLMLPAMVFAPRGSSAVDTDRPAAGSTSEQAYTCTRSEPSAKVVALPYSRPMPRKTKPHPSTCAIPDDAFPAGRISTMGTTQSGWRRVLPSPVLKRLQKERAASRMHCAMPTRRLCIMPDAWEARFSPIRGSRGSNVAIFDEARRWTPRR